VRLLRLPFCAGLTLAALSTCGVPLAADAIKQQVSTDSVDIARPRSGVWIAEAFQPVIPNDTNVAYLDVAQTWTALQTFQGHATIGDVLTITNNGFPARSFALFHYNPSIATFPVPTFVPTKTNVNLALDLFPNGGALFTGRISGKTLTVTAMTAGSIAAGQVLNGKSVAAGTKITALGTGTGGTGTYTVNTSQTVASETMNSGVADYANPTTGSAWEDICDNAIDPQCLHLSIGNVEGVVGIVNYGSEQPKPLIFMDNGHTGFEIKTNGVPWIDKHGAGIVWEIGMSGGEPNETTTPDELTLGNDVSAVPGSNPKLAIFDASSGVWGLGASSDGFEFITSPTSAFAWWMGGSSAVATMNTMSLALAQTTGSTSSATGALTVAGGVGVGGTLHVGGDIVAGSSSLSGVALSLQNNVGTCTLTPTTSTASFSCTSDERLKSAISDTSVGPSWLDTFRVRDYTVDADGSRHTGVIAQELRVTHPEMIHALRDGTLTVDTPDAWRMLRAMQGLQSEINVLTKLTWGLALAAIGLVTLLLWQRTAIR